MPFDEATLAYWLAAVGGTDSDTDAEGAVAQQLSLQELGRDADPSVRQSILSAIETGLELSDVRVALRSSYERLVRDNSVAGHNSDAFRRLTAVASVENLPASSADVAACVAVYRLMLGREPDAAGFGIFLSYIHDQSLAVAVREIVASPEAARYFAPDPPPLLTSALPAVLLAAGQVLHAVGSDTTLGNVVIIDGKMGKLEERLEVLEKKLDQFMEMVLLRLDADALEP